MSYWVAWSIRTPVIFKLILFAFRTCNSIPDISDRLSFKTTYACCKCSHADRKFWLEYGQIIFLTFYMFFNIWNSVG